MKIDPHRFKTVPRPHQLLGVQKLVDHPAFALFDEQRLGKSKQVIDAVSTLHAAKKIDTVVVVAPATVRAVWDDPDLGQIFLHGWGDFTVERFDARTKELFTFDGEPRESWRGLAWIVTNYDILRGPHHLKKLTKALKGRHVLLVLDEAIRIKSRTAQQTKAVRKLRAVCERCWLLNGTPTSGNVLDLWAQFDVCDPEILGEDYWQFRGRYAVEVKKQARRFDPRTKREMVWNYRDIVGFRDVTDLKKRLAPFVLRRERESAPGAPEKDHTFLEAKLSRDTWRLYTEMRDQLVAYLTRETPSVARHGGIKALRLSQLCNGYLGGIDDGLGGLARPSEVGREKLDVLLEWLEDRPVDEPLLVWCRFRAELERVVLSIPPERRIGFVAGGQTAVQREETLRRFTHGEVNVIVGQPQAGGWGLNLSRARTVIYLSNDYNLVTRLQSEDRAIDTAQKDTVLYVDFLATGPEGQRTIDHAVLKALRKKEDVAAWTVEAWRRALSEER